MHQKNARLYSIANENLIENTFRTPLLHIEDYLDRFGYQCLIVLMSIECTFKMLQLQTNACKKCVCWQNSYLH